MRVLPALGLLLWTGTVSAGPPTTPCAPGYQWVEVDSHTEAVRYVGKLVPGVNKVRKVVYSTREEPFCVATHGHDPVVHTRKILVKKEVVTEEPTVKCVVERVVEQVPCKVWRQVPVLVRP